MLFEVGRIKKVKECGRGVKGRGVNVDIEVTRDDKFRREGVEMINKAGEIREKFRDRKRRRTIN